VGDRAILITYLNSACKNTQKTQISFHMTKSMFTNVITSLVCRRAILNLYRPGSSSNNTLVPLLILGTCCENSGFFWLKYNIL